MSGHKKARDQSNHRPDEKRVKIVPCFHGDVGVDDAGHAGIVAARAGIERAHQSGKHGVYRYAYKDNAQRRQPSLIGKAVDQQKRDHAAEKSEQRSKEKQRREECGNQHGGKACAAADAYNSGIGKRIFHHRLQENAGNSGRRAAKHSDKNAGETKIKDRRHIGVIFNKQSSEQLRRRHFQTAGIDGKEKECQKPCGCETEGQYLFSCTDQAGHLLI